MGRPRVALDLDGVIVDHIPTWTEFYLSNAQSHRHPQFLKNHFTQWGSWDLICQQCLYALQEDANLLLSHIPMPQAVTGIETLSQIADLYILSHRWMIAIPPTIEWLDRLGIRRFFKEVIVTKDSKRAVCENIGISYMVDDAPYNFTAFQGSPTNFILFDARYNRHLLGARVRNWNDLTKYITSLTEKINA